MGAVGARRLAAAERSGAPPAPGFRPASPPTPQPQPQRNSRDVQYDTRYSLQPAGRADSVPSASQRARVWGATATARRGHRHAPRPRKCTPSHVPVSGVAGWRARRRGLPEWTGAPPPRLPRDPQARSRHAVRARSERQQGTRVVTSGNNDRDQQAWCDAYSRLLTPPARSPPQVTPTHPRLAGRSKEPSTAPRAEGRADGGERRGGGACA